MIRLDAPRPASLCSGPTRRDFLHAGALAPLGLTLPDFVRAKASRKDRDINCILLMLVGGPSQIDTWDPKPNAPAEVRGPFRPTRTNVPGIQIAETFPRMAKLADQFSLLRSVYHTASAVHDTGYQLMQSGRLFTGGVEHPNAGCVLGYLKGGRGELPAHVMIPGPIGRTGGNLPHGESAGYLGPRHDPFILPAGPTTVRDAVDEAVAVFEGGPHAQQMDENVHAAYRLMTSARASDAFALEKEPRDMRDRYGRTRFGQSCLMARRLIEAGVRFVTVNMFETVFDQITWDIHGSRPFTDIEEMAKFVAPSFDQTYSMLLEDLRDRGLLETTMVVACGEFGRTPRINTAGGRDHHPGVWTMLMAGGPIQGGRVIGESDALGSAPKSRPVTPAEVAATIYQGLGLDLRHELPGPQNRPLPLVDPSVEPIGELF